MSEHGESVVITDVKIPFWSMVTLLVKLAIAAIPAIFILMALGMAVATALAMIFGTGWHHWEWGMGGRQI